MNRFKDIQMQGALDRCREYHLILLNMQQIRIGEIVLLIMSIKMLCNGIIYVIEDQLEELVEEVVE